jgi:beta-glucosidase
VATPVKALRGFSRVTLQPGQRGEVSFEIGSEALSLWNREMQRVVEPGDFRIMVGSSSSDIRGEGILKVSE